MANASFSRTSRRALLTALLPLLAAAPGCNDRIGKCYAVEGTVYIEGRPLVGKSGFVTFKPDVSKGNQGEFAAVGPLNPDGTYTLSTQSKDGAPAGWYRVTVTAVDEKDGAVRSGEPNQSRDRQAAKWCILATARRRRRTYRLKSSPIRRQALTT